MKEMLRLLVPLIGVSLVVTAGGAPGQQPVRESGSGVPARSAARVGIERRTGDLISAAARESHRPTDLEDPLGVTGGGRSKLLAGAMSAFVPGLGSFYAGNARHGAVHLLIHTVTGVYVLVGSMSCLTAWGGETECEGGAVNVAALGWLVNWGWSIVSAVTDAGAQTARR
jgi:hypothetical protein